MIVPVVGLVWRGHKLYKKYCNSNVRKNYFSNRVINVCNSLPLTVDFSTLYSFITFILFPRTVRDWNILPEVVVRASSSEVFSGMIHA